jgi:hypothetical protein
MLAQRGDRPQGHGMAVDRDDRQAGLLGPRGGEQLGVGNVAVENGMAVAPPCCTRFGSVSKATKSTRSI